MARYTSEQDKYYKGMKLLIELYYSYKSMGDKSDIAPEFIEKFIEIFRIFIPGFDSFVCIERKELITFLFNRDSALNIHKPSISLIARFAELIQSIKDQTKNHFNQITRLGETVRSYGGDEKRSADNSFELFLHEKLSRVRAGISDKKYIITTRSKLNLNMKSDDMPLLPKQVTKLCDELFDNVLLPEYRHQSYSVEVASAFGRTIVDYNYISRQYDSILIGIPYVHAPGYDKQIKFHEFLNGAFFGFYIAFGSFDRVKLCMNKSCERLFVEKRLDFKEFCSNICRKKHHDSLQDPAKRLCREKQNAWIRNKCSPEYTLHRPSLKGLPEYHVFMDDCNSCLEQEVKSGFCKKLEGKYEEKYKKVFIALREKGSKKESAT